MALIVFGSSKCSLCGQLLLDPNTIVATSAFIDDTSDTFWRYSDSGMHRQCFLSWEFRDEFRLKYNNTHQDRMYGDGTFKRMEADGSISSIAEIRDDSGEK